jgi:hypothetical protein
MAGRRTKGDKAQRHSDTQLFAYIATRLGGVDNSALDAWADQLGLDLDGEAIRHKPAAAERLNGRDHLAVIRPWLSVDWRALDFFFAIIDLEGEPTEQELREIEAIAGVIDLFVILDEHRLIAHVIYERLQDRERLRVKLGEFGAIKGWREVAQHRPGGAVSTARMLATEAADREHLRTRG